MKVSSIKKCVTWTRLQCCESSLNNKAMHSLSWEHLQNRCEFSTNFYQLHTGLDKGFVISVWTRPFPWCSPVRTHPRNFHTPVDFPTPLPWHKAGCCNGYCFTLEIFCCHLFVGPFILFRLCVGTDHTESVWSYSSCKKVTLTILQCSEYFNNYKIFSSEYFLFSEGSQKQI